MPQSCLTCMARKRENLCIDCNLSLIEESFQLALCMGQEQSPDPKQTKKEPSGRVTSVSKNQFSVCRCKYQGN